MRYRLFLAFSILFFAFIGNVVSQTMYPISWTDKVGVITDKNNGIVKTASDGWGNGGAASINNFGLTGSVEFVVTETGIRMAFGLSPVNADANYTSIYYGFIFLPGNQFNIVENGSTKILNSSYAVGDKFTITKGLLNITYKKNTTTIKTDLNVNIGGFLVDLSLFDGQHIINNIKCSARAALIADAGVGVTTSAGVGKLIGGSPTARGGTLTYSYSWTPNNGTLNAVNIDNPTASPTITTTYHVVVTDNQSSTSSSNVVVTVLPTLLANAGLDKDVMITKSVVIGGTTASPTASGSNGGPYTYLWSSSSGTTPSPVINPTVSPTITTTYSVTVSDNLGGTKSDAVVVTVYPLLVAYAGPKKGFAIIKGTSATLGGTTINPTGSGGKAPYTYLWNPTTGMTSGGSTSGAPAVTPTISTQYFLTVTDVLGDTQKDTIYVQVLDTVKADAGSDATIWRGSSKIIGANNGPTGIGGASPYTYTWNPNTSLNPVDDEFPTATPTVTTTYTVTVSDIYGNSASDNVVITVIDPMIVNAGADVNIISGTIKNLGGNPTAIGGKLPYSYLWNHATDLNSSSTANPDAHPTVTTTYTVTVTDGIGSTSTDNIVVNVYQPLVINAGADKIIFTGTQTQLGALPTISGGKQPYVFSWTASIGTNPSSVTNPNVTPTVTTTYNLSVTDAIGNSSTDALIIDVLPLLVANAGTDASIVTGESTIIGGTPVADGGRGPYTYYWNSGSFTSTLQHPTVSPTSTELYSVTITDALGNTSSDEVIITVLPPLSVEAGNNTTTIAGFKVSLGGSPTASGGIAPYIYNWGPTLSLDDYTVSNPLASPTVTTTYTVTVTDALNHTLTDQIVVNVIRIVTVNAGKNAFINPGGTVSLGGTPTASGATPPYTYSWSPTTGLSSATSSNPTVTNTQSTAYYVTVTDATGLTGSAGVYLGVDETDIDFCWATHAGTSSEYGQGALFEAGNDIKIDAAGNSYVAGSLIGTYGLFGGNTNYDSTGVALFDQDSLKTRKDLDGFLAKYDQDGKVLWETLIGGRGREQVTSLTLDIDGNILVTGVFNDTCYFGKGSNQIMLICDNITSNSFYPNRPEYADHDIFVAKYNSSGNLVWAEKYSGSGDDINPKIQSGKTGDFYLTGEYSDQFNINGTTLSVVSSYGARNSFLAKFSSSHILQWVTTLASENENLINDVKIDENNNIYIIGEYSSPTSFGSGSNISTITPCSGYWEESFIAKYNNQGIIQWVKNSAGNGQAAGISLDVDTITHSIYAAGYFGDDISFECGTTPIININPGTSAMFVCKYSLDGNLVWSKAGSSSGLVKPFKIKVKHNYVYIAGAFYKDFTFDNHTTLGYGDYDALVLKMDLNGNYKWSVKSGSVLIDCANSLDVDFLGNVYSTGIFWGIEKAYYGPGSSVAICKSISLTSYGNSDIFVSKICDGIEESVVSFNNYGTAVLPQGNADINVYGNILNEKAVSNGIDGYFINTGTLRLTKHWKNNAGDFVFTIPYGVVEMFGGAQKLRGYFPTEFFNLNLTGAGIKTMYINEYLNGVLQLLDDEIATQRFTLHVNTTNVNAIQRNNGFVSSMDLGFLKRDMDQNTIPYLFPVGSSKKPGRYRPLEIKPTTPAFSQYNVRFVNKNPLDGGYNPGTKQASIEVINPKYYHIIQTPVGNAADITSYFDKLQDGAFQGMAYWTTSYLPTGYVPYYLDASPAAWFKPDNWIFSPSISPALSSVTSSAHGYFSGDEDPFSLSRSGFSVNTQGFGGQGGSVLNYDVEGPGLGDSTGGSNGGNNPTGGSSTFVPVPCGGTGYKIKVKASPNSTALDITFDVNSNCEVSNVTVDGHPLSDDLYEIINGSNFVLKSTPKEGINCLNNDIAIKVNNFYGSPLVLQTGNGDKFNIQNGSGVQIFNRLQIFKQDGTVVTDLYGTDIHDNVWDGNINGVPAPGLYRFELTVNKSTPGGPANYVFKGQFIVK